MIQNDWLQTTPSFLQLILKTSLVTMNDLRAYNTSLQNISDRMLFQITKYVQHPDIFCILKCRQWMQMKVVSGGLRANTETALSLSLRWSFSKSLYILSFFSGSIIFANSCLERFRGYGTTEVLWLHSIALWFTEPSCNKITPKYFMENISL